MALQDLTPQLRTRLSRMERAVGGFVFLAAALLLFGFGYYIYHTAERKGWFKIKAEFVTYLQSSAGLNVGDPVVMMGFQVGHIISVEPQPPRDAHNVQVKFEILEPYFRYLWSGGSVVKVNAADFLGKRQLEVTRATNGPAFCVTQPVTVFTNLAELERRVATETNQWQLSQNIYDKKTNRLFSAYAMLDTSLLEKIAGLKLDAVHAYNNTVNRQRIVAVWREEFQRYEAYRFGQSAPVDLAAAESPAIGDRLEKIVSQVENAVPNFLALTNPLAVVLANAANATSNLNVTLVEARPMVTNFALLSGQLREPGGLGVWALGANGNGQIQLALTNVNALLSNTDTNLAALLINLAGITGGLNAQVQAHSNLLGGIYQTVVDADDMVQGLKRHWLLRSAFKVKATNLPPATVTPLLPPRLR